MSSSLVVNDTYNQSRLGARWFFFGSLGGSTLCYLLADGQVHWLTWAIAILSLLTWVATELYCWRKARISRF